MNSKARCQRCRRWRPMAELRPHGLGRVCAEPCEAVPVPAKGQPGARRRKPPPRRRGLPHHLRRQVDARDQRTCRWCGDRPAVIHRHHVLYRGMGGDPGRGRDALDNILTLCEAHHRLAHSDKGRWQPVLLYVLGEGARGRWLTVPEAEAELLAAHG